MADVAAPSHYLVQHRGRTVGREELCLVFELVESHLPPPPPQPPTQRLGPVVMGLGLMIITTGPSLGPS